MFIDIHAHLEFFNNIEMLIENAIQNNVKLILACGVDSKTNKFVLKISDSYEELKACLGVYPIDALKMSDKEINKEIDFIKKNKNKIIAIGEVGLDLKEAGEQTIGKQEANLKKFILLAKELNVPVIIHSRKAEEFAINLLEEIGYNKIIMHCFMGNMNLVKKIIKNNWYLSIPTISKRSKHFQEIIKITPLNQLFCETDSPFLHAEKKFPNEPANVIESYKKIADIKNLPLEAVEKEIEMNFRELFN